jgi:hypothetical protein
MSVCSNSNEEESRQCFNVKEEDSEAEEDVEQVSDLDYKTQRINKLLQNNSPAETLEIDEEEKCPEQDLEESHIMDAVV